ncbi:TetR/AcrR family transcriptional regulator [candidate division WOR-3 bacterium]|nr:TetR/AcrR family transcriptional regulator [candidate division WOR-3 bacterium]
MKKRKRMSGEERKKRIINASMKIFSKKGFQGTKTKEIAKAAGVSEAMIFKYFKTKNDIYNSIISSKVKDHSKEISDIQSKISNLPRVLKETILHVINLNEKDPTFLRLMLYSSLEEHRFAHIFVETHLSGNREAFARAIEKGIKMGAYRKVNPKLAAQIFEYLIGGYCIEQFVLGKNKPLDKKEIAETIVDIFLNGLKKRQKHIKFEKEKE